MTLEKLEEIKDERLIQMERVIETFDLDTAYAGYSQTIIDRYKRFRETGKFEYDWDAGDKRSIEESWTRVDKAKCMAKEYWTRGPLFNQQKLELEVELAISKEKEYERCNYRRTTCKALETLTIGYNRLWTLKEEFNPEPNNYYAHQFKPCYQGYTEKSN